MCGIAGLVRFAGLRPGEHAAGARMAATLSHRGPDDAGFYNDAQASIGHARLSIIDLDAGRQPMSNEDGTIWVCFNGEIYNHDELAQCLRRRGHRFRTRCDTEVLVHLYEEQGEDFLHQLNGMFALAVWDTRKHTLLIARDRIGIKPLYWHHDGRRVLFGSELKALTAVKNLPLDTDNCALQDYLTFGHIPAPRTIYKKVQKLEPGCLAVFRESGARIRRWWDIPFNEQESNEPLSLPEQQQWTDQFAELLEDAIAIRMIADVPLGAFLSGGVDSSTITAGMCRRSSNAIRTQTVGFDESDYDERTAARNFAKYLDTDHHEVMVRPDALQCAQQLVHHFDEPFADASAVPMFYLSQATRRNVTVALSGDGGDEMLAGYRRYHFDLAEQNIRRIAPRWLRQATFGLAGCLYPRFDWLPRPLRAKATLSNLACDPATAHLRSVALLAGNLPRQLMNRDLLQENNYDAFDRGRELYNRCTSNQLLNRMLYMDMKTLMVDDILTKVDRASMAVGLEVRTPLLDHRIVELAARMPVSMKRNGRIGKYILRQTLQKWTDPQYARRNKKGFDVPLHDWFRGPLRDVSADLLLNNSSALQNWLQPKAVHKIFNDHQAGYKNNGHLLWMLLNLEMWARKPKETPAPQKQPVTPNENTKQKDKDPVLV
jgi:asparagine synthase (glutamine-hydrolysing)